MNLARYAELKSELEELHRQSLKTSEAWLRRLLQDLQVRLRREMEKERI